MKRQEPTPTRSPAEAEPSVRVSSLRDIINLLESDLAVAIGDVQRACDLVRREAEDSAAATAMIAQRTERLSSQAAAASRDISHLAEAIAGLAKTSDEIGAQTRRADELTGNAAQSAAMAGDSIAGLKKSSAEIGQVVNLISTIARQTNLLSLNAKIEAARAGDAGRGFAVVAAEVKKLSEETQTATGEISGRIEALQRDAEACFAAVEHITGVIKVIRPLFSAIAAAVAQQNDATTAVARDADETLEFANDVSVTAADIGAYASDANAQGRSVVEHGQDVLTVAEKLKTRLTIFLRQGDAGDRRRHERLPCEIEVTLQSGPHRIRSKTADLSEGGVLVRVADAVTIAAGDTVTADMAGIGFAEARAASRSSLGLHLEFLRMDDAVRARLLAKLAAIRNENDEFISRAIAVASNISAALEGLVQSGRLSREDLFDNDYIEIGGTSPLQHRTRFLAAFEQVLPEFLEAALASDERMIFCAAVDRNGYLPVHNRKYSFPQRPGELAWNTANSRNRRIFDDRAGLAAARNVRPYLIQVYLRDMGDGVTVMMREIDAPIRVFGRHWGGFRTAYRF
jgi:methyl-accepting chemotaxis protein